MTKKVLTNSFRMSVIFVTLPLFVLINSYAISQESKEEAIFGFKYNNYSVDFSVYIFKDSVYVPIEEILSFFKIYYTIDDNHRINGYVNNSDSSFVIDFQTKEIVDISKNKFRIDDNLWFSNDLQIYVRTDLIANVFKLSLTTYFNKLVINVKSTYQLPILRSINTEFTSNNFKRIENNEEMGPLITDKSFNILNGGIFDYSLGGSKSGAVQNYSFSNNLGLEVLGGEFQYNLSGSYNITGLNYKDNFRWRYLIDSKIINSVSIGNLQNSTIRNSGGRGYRKPYYNLVGVQITNETQKMPNVFTNYVIEDRIEPDWNVELYLEDQLYDAKRADISGYYRFEIPITYGLTNIKVKYYGPKGEFVCSEKVLNIPSEMLQPGEIKYTMTLGQDDITKNKVFDGAAFLGITRWLTNSITASKIENSKDYNLIYQTSLNLFDNFMINLLVANNGVYDVGFKIPIEKICNFDVNYTSYDRSFGTSGFLSTLNIMGSINQIFSLPFSLSIMGTRNQGKNSNSNTMSTSTNLYFNSISISLRHSLSFNDFDGVINNLTQLININTSYSINEMPDLLSFMGRINLSASTSLNPVDWKFSTIATGLQMELSRNISFNANFNYNPIYNSTDFRFGLNMNLSAFRSTSGIAYNQGQSSSITSDINGSIEFDSKNLKLSFLNSMGSSGIYGKSSAAIRFYNDINFNNKYDESDILIPEADFNITNEMASKNSVDGYKILNKLTPGTRYNVKVNTNSFPNPSIQPDISEFSFIAEPYSYKSIDIPCHVGGMIEGVVNRNKNDVIAGQGGVKVHIEGKDKNFRRDVSVFSDGTYFFSGLPVGEYTIYVDSLQTKILGCVSKPPVIRFEVKKSADGDFVSNLDFILSDNDSIAAIKKEIAAKTSKKQIKEKNKANSEDVLNNNDKKLDNTLNITLNDKEKLAVDSVTNEIQVPVNEPVFPKITDPIKPGTLHLLQFANERTTFLGPGMKRYLDRVVEFMISNSNYTLKIEGHSDNFGNLTDNFNVSHQRASEVVNYIVSKGIDKNRLISTAYGALRPISSYDNLNSKKKNRRVELTLIGNDSSSK
jgi:outer membrane protein OmpA-like peptidoglycan-associated protein